MLETVKDCVSERSWSDSQLTESSGYECNDDQQPKPFNQEELNDLVTDLNLSKASARILGTRLKAKRVLSTDITFAWYKHREIEYDRFFAKEHSFVNCVDVQGLIKKLETVYNSSDRRLFIDASKSSLNESCFVAKYKSVCFHSFSSFDLRERVL